MEVGILGFERGGKTTLFNAITGQEAATGGYSGQAEPNIAIVKVPDDRLDRLSAMYQSKKLVHATIKFIDVAGIAAREGEGGGSSLDEKLLRAVANADALMAVVRAFEEGGIAPRPEADAASIQSELILSDFVKVETRLERIEKGMLKQSGDARKALEREKAVLERCKEALEAERPLRALEFDADEEKVLRAFQFMTVKPLLIVLNVGEDEIAKCGEREAAFAAAGLAPGTMVVACCARAEYDISRIESPEERAMFLESYGIATPAVDRVIRVSYELLGLMSFFTVGPPEAHAWTIRRGDSALEAAAAIHSDLARGFIRAEVVSWDDLLRAGSLANAKKDAMLRLEGKTYVMRDGDVIEIRFSV